MKRRRKNVPRSPRAHEAKMYRSRRCRRQIDMKAIVVNGPRVSRPNAIVESILPKPANYYTSTTPTTPVTPITPISTIPSFNAQFSNPISRSSNNTPRSYQSSHQESTSFSHQNTPHSVSRMSRSSSKSARLSGPSRSESLVDTSLKLF